MTWLLGWERDVALPPATTDNPRVSGFLKLFSLAEALVLLWGGTLLFLFVGFTTPLWPWELTPFNARFLGGYYLGGSVAAALMVAVGRWAPTRVVMTMVFVFTSIVLFTSLFHLDRFIVERWTTWVWFGLYALIPVVTGAAVDA